VLIILFMFLIPMKKSSSFRCKGRIALEYKLANKFTVADIESLIKKGVISSGMIPKTECCIDAVKGGVNKTYIIDGRVEHSVLLEIFTDAGIGTEIVP
jgi:acetylglutamate kinase